MIKVAHTGLEGNIATKTSSDATAVEFGSELSDKFGVWECAPGVECMGVVLKMINYKVDYYSELSSTKPGIVTDKVRPDFMLFYTSTFILHIQIQILLFHILYIDIIRKIIT